MLPTLFTSFFTSMQRALSAARQLYSSPAAPFYLRKKQEPTGGIRAVKRIHTEMVDVGVLIPYEKNPRRNDDAVKAVSESIRAFGFKVPIVIDADNTIIAGHTRYKAALLLGLKKVPAVRADHLTPEQVKAFRLADNKVGETSIWNKALLNAELNSLLDSMDMSLFGFDLGIDNIADLTDTSREIDVDDFGDGSFEYCCPECGFRFNEYV